MLTIAVCDDDVKFTGQLEKMLMTLAEQKCIQVEIDVFWDGSELVHSICEENQRYDLIFLDFEMREMDGLSAAKKIRKKDEITLLIYVTSHKSFAIKAYEVQPFQFMVKPVSYTKLGQYFMKAYQKIIAGDFRFQFKYGKNFFTVLVNDIVYFKSEKRIIYIYLNNGERHKYYDKLDNVEEQLKNEKVDFWRIHQSYFVNTRYIIRKSYDQIELSDHKVLFISEDRRKKISEQYFNYIEGEIIE